MRSEIVRIHREVGATTIYVTHDQIEAMTMATRIVVMKDGFIQQIGTPDEVYHNPANMFVAGFIGTPAMNFMHGILENGYFIPDDTEYKIALSEEQKGLLKEYEGKRIVYGIRPEDVVYSQSSRFEQLKDCSFDINCNIVEKLGDIINVHGTLGGKEMVVKMSGKYVVDDKKTITVAVDREHARFFNESTTMAITEQNCAYVEIEQPVAEEQAATPIVEDKKEGKFAKFISKIKNIGKNQK